MAIDYDDLMDFLEDNRIRQNQQISTLLNVVQDRDSDDDDDDGDDDEGE